MMNFSFKTRKFVLKSKEFCIKNDELCRRSKASLTVNVPGATFYIVIFWFPVGFRLSFD